MEQQLEPQQVVTYLKQIPLFQRFTGERGELELYHVARVVREYTYEKGSWLFGQGVISDRLLFILEGHVRLTRVDRDGITHQLGDRGPGEVLGETGLLVGDFHDVTVEALEDVRVLYILRDEFSKLCDEQPYLRRHLNVRPELSKRRNLPHFDWLRDDEWVIFAARRHWSQFVRLVMPPLLLFLLLLPVFGALVVSPNNALRLLSVILALPLLALGVLLGWQYLNWRDDFFVLTTQRIVHIERIWPLKTSFEESSLDNIEDIYELRPSLTANILNYGNLILQTAGETVQIDMDRISDPDDLREKIFREIERTRARDVLRQRGAIREALARYLEIADSTASVKTEMAEPAAKQPIPFLTVFLGGLMDYFFPSSWSESADGGTIIWRRYWFPGFLRYMRAFVPLALLTVFGGSFLVARWGQEGTNMLLAVWLFVEAVLFGALLWFVEDWRNDYFQLTPNRIILVNRKPLLLQSSRHEASLDNIQNISFEVPNPLANFLGYGHVMLETAGTLGKFELKWLKMPQRVQAEISKRQRAYMEREKGLEAQRRQDELLTWFASYDEIRKEVTKPANIKDS
ncbi:MAG: cyclic nucleotide-binding domain-containing protein [Anaerolineae bacterium]|nr:cyclic nucleotide-binding domain-containing protein [Anaerolineae bacterium]